ncbi:hypothetical protein [Longitalea luteola]|uniref:hypothetical protein n=1 Tax=Longitalea luteola TaxID=2812563 RepID=UPI001A972ECF|nr:hypothetical protein [Longitalea luteola]
MPIHIGHIIQAEVELKRLTQKEFGALIHKNEKTVPDIYNRATMSIDLLVAISVALKKDFIKFFYDAEPMKSIRDDETILLKSEIQKIMQEKITLERELALMQNLVESQKETICFAKEQLDHYKSKLLEFSGNKPGLSAI